MAVLLTISLMADTNGHFQRRAKENYFAWRVDIVTNT